MSAVDQAGCHGREQERAHVTKLVGAPGSGKTTNLLRLLRDELRDGTPLDDVLFCSFTRASREEIEDRLLDIADDEGALDDLDDDTAPTDSVRTVHGAALKAALDAGAIELRNRDNLDDRGQLLIRRTDDQDSCYFSWFFGQHFPTVEYDPEGDDPIERLQSAEWDDANAEVPAGNQVMAVYDHLQSKGWPLDRFYRAPLSEGIDLPDRKIIEVLREWDAFKERNDLIQDADYVKRAVDRECPPPGRVVFIDEFQDLSPLQIRLYEMWRDSARSTACISPAILIRRSMASAAPSRCISTRPSSTKQSTTRPVSGVPRK